MAEDAKKMGWLEWLREHWPPWLPDPFQALVRMLTKLTRHD